MCLGIPGRITEIWTEASVPMAHADFAGTARKICLAYVPGLGVGDYVITHMGYALTHISEEDARQTLEMMREYGVLGGEAGPGPEMTGGQPAGPVMQGNGGSS